MSSCRVFGVWTKLWPVRSVLHQPVRRGGVETFILELLVGDRRKVHRWVTRVVTVRTVVPIH